MDIILVSGRLAKTRTIRLSAVNIVLLAFAAFLLLVTAAIAVQYPISRLDRGLMSDRLRGWLASAQSEQQQQQAMFMRESLDTMAKRLGRMQAQMQRLDALGSRLAKLSGIKPGEFNFDAVPAQGGPYLPAPNRDISMQTMDTDMAKLSLSIDDRNDKLLALQTMLLQDRSNAWLIPSVMPVKNSYFSSNFGWRIDPFTGKEAMHEGVDFVVPTGTAVYASAGGIVQYAGPHPQFGNLVEIDHGNGVITRYAHNSKVLVQVGQMVRRGQKIALSGATGRATGPHVHFEVRYKGVAQNPARFLKNADPKAFSS
ncbi:MAG TPA: M23 family metallopeptidase [Gallionellaceae bacterium]|nr:M23 family metallopeptidase [Gallionellaceae bacterium]